MKKLIKSVVVLLGIFLIGCTSQEFDENRYIRLEIQDALTVENSQSFFVGDTIYFEANFSRYLEEEGYDNLLDIYESTDSETFAYGFELNKFSEQSNGFGSITIAPEFLVAEKGTIDEFYRVEATLNQNQDTYESRIGLILAEAGTFELDFSFLDFYSTSYDADKVQIQIEHIFSDAIDKFEFEVTE
jgi:RNA binding exosome subunit